MAEYTNTVPLGRAGTGSAFLLGESQATDRYLQQLDRDRAIAEQQKQREAQQLANDWNRNALKVDGGLYWQNEFNDRVNNHVQRGIQLRNMGVNPYGYNTDPLAQKAQEEYMLERAQLEQDMDGRKALEGQLKSRFDLLRANPDKYEPETISKLNKFVEGSYADAIKSELPNLQERFNPLPIVSKIMPTVQPASERIIGNEKVKTSNIIDKDATTASIKSSLLADPQSARWVSRLTGGFSIPQLERIPKTKEAITKRIVDEYDSDRQLRESLAQQGIVGKDSQSFKQYVNSEADRRFNAKNAWDNEIESLYSTISGKVKPSESRLPNYQGMNYNLAVQRENRLRNQEDGGTKNDDEIYYRNQLIDRVFAGAKGEQSGVGSGEEIKAILEGKGFNNTWTYPNDDKSDPNSGKVVNGAPFKVLRYTGKDGKPTGKIKITVAPRTVTTTTVDNMGEEVVRPRTISSRSITLDPNKNEDRSKLNSFLNDVTGEKISESKIRTNQASGKLKTSSPQQSTNNTTKKKIIW